MTDPASDPTADAHLRAALRHAPDATLHAPELLSARILASARRAAAGDAGPAGPRWMRFAWGGAGTLAAAMLASVALWVGRDEWPEGGSASMPPSISASRSENAPASTQSPPLAAATSAAPPAPTTPMTATPAGPPRIAAPVPMPVPKAAAPKPNPVSMAGDRAAPAAPSAPSAPPAQDATAAAAAGASPSITQAGPASMDVAGPAATARSEAVATAERPAPPQAAAPAPAPLLAVGRVAAATAGDTAQATAATAATAATGALRTQRAPMTPAPIVPAAAPPLAQWLLQMGTEEPSRWRARVGTTTPRSDPRPWLARLQAAAAGRWQQPDAEAVAAAARGTELQLLRDGQPMATIRVGSDWVLWCRSAGEPCVAARIEWTEADALRAQVPR